MANIRLHPDDKKETLTIRIRKSLIDRLRKEKGYNKLIENMIEEYFRSRDQNKD